MRGSQRKGDTSYLNYSSLYASFVPSLHDTVRPSLKTNRSTEVHHSFNILIFCYFFFFFFDFQGSREPINKEADVLFVVDSSFSVPRDDYKKEQEFVKTMARSLNIPNGKTRIGYITYGSTALVSFTLDRYTDLRDFDDKVDKAIYVGGSRRIDRALTMAVRELQSEGRQDVPKLVVLLTAGRQSPAQDAVPLGQASKPLRDMGAKTYVIALGSQPSTQELRPVVERPEDILTVRSYDHLRPRAHPIASDLTRGLSKYHKVKVMYFGLNPSCFILFGSKAQQ